MESESRASIRKRRKQHLLHVLGQFFLAGAFAISILAPPKMIGNSTTLISKIFIAGLPVFALTIWAGMIAKQIYKLDEFSKTLAINSLAVTFGVMLWTITSYEIIGETFGLPNFPIFLLAPIAVTIWHIFWEILRNRYT